MRKGLLQMNKFFLLCLSFVLMFGLVACSSSTSGGDSSGNTSSGGSDKSNASGDQKSGSKDSDSGKKYTIKIGHVNPPGEPTYETFLNFVKPELEKRSNGQFEVKLYPQSQLGSENELLEQAKIGTVQVAAASAPANHSSKLNIFYLPYLFEDQDQLWKVMDGPVGQEFNTDLEQKTGTKIVGWWSVGVRHFFTKGDKEIRNVEDVQGLKIRVMPQPVLTEIFKGMGMLPTPLPYGEVYGALATNVVDAAENDPSGYKNMKFYEVAPNYSLSSHIAYPKVIVINPKFYNGLPDDLKKVIDDVFAEAQTKQRQMFVDIMDKEIQWMKDNGINVIEDVDIDSFKEKAQSLWVILVGGFPSNSRFSSFSLKL